MTGETVGTRALVDNMLATAYAQAKLVAGFASEAYTALEAPELTASVKAVDTRAAEQLTSRFRLEHTDIFCLERDLAYANRSRRWLFAKGWQTRMNRSYAMWQQFTTENTDKPAMIQKLLNMDAKQLARVPFDTIFP